MLTRLLLGIAICLSLSARADPPSQPLIAAAADLQFALTDVATFFERDTGHSVRLVFGSSGNFYRQIREGAPFQLFLSADEYYVEQLARNGKTLDQGILYALGRLALFAPNGSSLQVDGQLQGLKSALASGSIKRFAIASPQHAPYGQRAEEALRNAGLWEALQGRLVLGENVAQAAQFATSGNAQGGIIAYSLALSPALARRGKAALIPETWHQPLRQRMVLLKDAGETSREFYRYLQEPHARNILRQYGFVVPDNAQ